MAVALDLLAKFVGAAADMRRTYFLVQHRGADGWLLHALAVTDTHLFQLRADSVGNKEVRALRLRELYSVECRVRQERGPAREHYWAQLRVRGQGGPEVLLEALDGKAAELQGFAADLPACSRDSAG